MSFAGFAAAAHGQQQSTTEIYKCLDSNGRFNYTNEKKETVGKKCEVVSSQINVAPAPAKPAAGAPRPPGSASTAPRETPSARASARERQREILEGELQTEEGLLAKARQALTEQEAIRTGDERNYARVLERLQPFRDNVELHEKNIAALKRELGNLYR